MISVNPTDSGPRNCRAVFSLPNGPPVVLSVKGPLRRACWRALDGSGHFEASSNEALSNKGRAE
jgi:hypothetical protein